MKEDILSTLVQKHGGMDRWQKFKRIHAVISAGGLAFRIKCNNKGMIRRRYIISIDQPMVILEAYPRKNYQGIFTPDVVWIEDVQGIKIMERINPRAWFTRFPHNFIWDNLDLLYFSGYAIWNYFNFPFIFTDSCIHLEDYGKWSENGEDLHRIKVTFPDDYPTHCKYQIFYIGAEGLIRRFDYQPEIF